MGKPSRNSTPDHLAGTRTFFVSSSTSGRRRLLQSDRMAGLLIDVLYHYRSEGRFRLHEFVIMPDHIHVLLSVGPEISIERAVQLIKGGSSYRASHSFSLPPQLWQRGFSEVRILNATDFDTHVRYIRENPVRTRLVSKAEEYRYSSAFPGYELDPSQFAAAKAALESELCGTTKVVP